MPNGACPCGKVRRMWRRRPRTSRRRFALTAMGPAALHTGQRPCLPGEHRRRGPTVRKTRVHGHGEHLHGAGREGGRRVGGVRGSVLHLQTRRYHVLCDGSARAGCNLIAIDRLTIDGYLVAPLSVLLSCLYESQGAPDSDALQPHTLEKSSGDRQA